MLLGLAGEVDLADYRAVFGMGGAHDPRTGQRLVGCLRPGLELVIHLDGGATTREPGTSPSSVIE